MKKFFQRNKRILCITGPIFISLIFILLCFVNISQSIWFDESYGAYIIRFKFSDIVRFTSSDVHPPLYYFLLKTWAHFFGYNIVLMRLLSAFLGAGAILFAFKWLKYKYGAKAAFLGSLTLVCSPFMVRYGQEMRMYTLILFIFFAATYFLQLAIDAKKKLYWIIYGVLVTLGMWTHYFTAFAWAAQLIYILTIYKKDFFKRKIFLVYILSVLLFIPWIPSLIAQTREVQQGFWIPDVSIKTIADLWTEFTVYTQSDMASNWGLFLVIANIIVYAFILTKTYKKQRYLTILAVAPIILLSLISMPPLKPMLVSRYIYYSAACLAMIPGLGIALLANSDKSLRKNKESKSYKKSVLRYSVLTVVLAANTIYGLFNLYSVGNYNFTTEEKSTAKELFANIEALSIENEPVIIDSKKSLFLYFDLSFYETSEHPVLFINELTDYEYGSLLPLKESYFGRIDDFAKFKKENKSFWYIGEELDEKEDLLDDFEILEEAKLQLHEKGKHYTLWRLQSK